MSFESVFKQFGSNVVLGGLTASIPPGRITGLLGPNGSGKSTLLRILLGLVRADSGHALIRGKRVRDMPFPVQEVGALLDAAWVHPNRSALNHLRWIARASDLPDRNASQALASVGLADVGDRKVGRFSLGMKQRLGIAATLLGNPDVLVFDEPLNGLDQSGVEFVREFLLREAERGQTVLIASHLLPEMALVADDLLVLGRGTLLFNGSLDDFVKDNAATVEVVYDPELINELPIEATTVAHGWTWTVHSRSARGATGSVGGATTSEVMAAFFEFRAGIISISEGHSLEERYLQLTSAATEFRTKSEPS
ncbi:MAG: ATP-binding cassette domain-containing protein [Kineosporiaceae bacterium]|nr:ATP-binding cassette domain-containing protein [Aeromicrobium sp.]